MACSFLERPIAFYFLEKEATGEGLNEEWKQMEFHLDQMGLMLWEMQTSFLWY